MAGGVLTSFWSMKLRKLALSHSHLFGEHPKLYFRVTNRQYKLVQISGACSGPMVRFGHE